MIDRATHRALVEAGYAPLAPYVAAHAVAPQRVAPGARVAVLDRTREPGTIAFRGEVTGASATHLRVRVDDGLVVMVPREDCIPEDRP